MLDLGCIFVFQLIIDMMNINDCKPPSRPQAQKSFFKYPVPDSVNGSNSGSIRRILLGLGIGLVICLLIVGVYLFLNRNNDDMLTNAITIDDIADTRAHQERECETDDVIEDYDISNQQVSSEYSAMAHGNSEECDDDVSVSSADTQSRQLNGSSTAVTRNYSFSGSIDGYPVKMWITCYSDGSVKGKYCYNSTIEKYGNSPSSYFYLTGKVTDNSSCLQLISREYKKEQPFERIEIRVDDGDVYSELVSVNSGRNHSLDLRRTDY